MKLYNTLKDPSMKYPRVANRLLDLSMLLVVIGGLACCGVALGMLSFSWVPLGVFLIGVVIHGAVRVVARLKNDTSQVGVADSPRLKLVK
jgi:hypothetical protein